MNIFWIIVSLVMGALLGAFHFGALWVTVRRLPTAEQPEVLMMLSFLIRAGGVLLGLYLFAGANVERLLLCLIGFIIARTVLVRYLRVEVQDADQRSLSDIARTNTK